MPRVVEHHDHPMWEEVASSVPYASHCPPSRVVARVALTQPTPNGPLVAARELLHNLPDAAASPDVLR
jgi:hypothetical protein